MLSNWNTPFPPFRAPFARQSPMHTFRILSIRRRRSRSMDDRPFVPSFRFRARKRGSDNDLCIRWIGDSVIVRRIELGFNRVTDPSSLRIDRTETTQHGAPLVHERGCININDCIYDNLRGTNASQLNLSILANVIDHRVFVTTNYAIVFPYWNIINYAPNGSNEILPQITEIRARTPTHTHASAG